MRAPIRRSRRAIVVGGILLLTAAASCSGRSGHSSAGMVLKRGDAPRAQGFEAPSAGEAFADIAASAPNVSWQQTGSESAVASLSVDGRYVTDIVVPSADVLRRSFALGAVTAGKHALSLVFAGDRSSPSASEVRIDTLTVRVLPPADPGYLAASHAPILIGRALPALGGPFQNARTDTPMVAFHQQAQAATPGHVRLEYSLVWSNEDGGTDTPALMARWGRTTDIEWIYRVELDQGGTVVPGTAVYQGTDHDTLPFRGAYENGHPVLQTCTENNNVCDRADGPMRLFLSAERSLPADRAREVLMDENPWTYRVMAEEMIREGKVENPSDPLTPGMGDQRTYLYVEIGKHTAGAGPVKEATPRLSIGIQLAGSPTVYRSDHSVRDWAVGADDPAAATTVELPTGTTPAQVARVIAIRQPNLGDDHSTITVSTIYRGFFLDPSYQPAPSFLSWTGDVTLSPQHPQATLIG